jgi:prepilin-type N-terminal cleavage/methylation domain-containing protein
MLQSLIEKKSKIHAMNTKSTKSNMRGFTLVELMVVVALTGIAVIAIYRGYQAFSQAADAQEQIIEMQQNLRVGMYWLEKDIRRAGMNEEDDENAGFEVADEATLTFNMDLWGDDASTGEDFDTLDGLDGTTDGIIEDITGDGDAPLPNDDGERIRYSRSDEDANGNGEIDAGEDANGNGVLDKNLLREVWACNAAGACDFGPLQTIITNVDALNFVYLDEDGQDIDPDTTPNDPTTGRNVLTVPQMERIRLVEVSLVVRTTNEDFRYTNNESYRNAQGALIYAAPGDHFRRRLSVKQIKIRNAGL